MGFAIPGSISCIPPQPAIGAETCEADIVKTLLRWTFILSALLWGAAPARRQFSAGIYNPASRY